MKFLTRIWLRFWHWLAPPIEADIIPFPKPEPPKEYPPTWLPPGVKTNGELRPHLPSKTNKGMRYDEVQRDRKRQRKGKHL